MDDFCSEVREDMTKRIVVLCHGTAKIVFCRTAFLNKLTTCEPPYMVTPNCLWSRLGYRLPNRISFDVYDRCFWKVETRACEKLRSCAKRLGGIAVTPLPGASRSRLCPVPRVHLIRPCLHSLPVLYFRNICYDPKGACGRNRPKTPFLVKKRDSAIYSIFFSGAVVATHYCAFSGYNARPLLHKCVHSNAFPW